MRAWAPQTGGQDDGHLWQRHHEHRRGEDMSEHFLSPDRLHALLVMFKEHHGKEYRFRTLGYWLLRT